MHLLQTKYQQALDAGKIQPDPAQAAAVAALDRVIHDVTRPSGKKLLSFLKKEKTVKGLYMYGSVGRGKTMLMDWCLQTLTENGIKAERWHFHAFMLDMHQNLNNLKAHTKHLDNRVEKLADQWVERVDVLCFDEFHVTDVADAMIMMPLFTRLFERGVTVIATSNWMPDELYSGGLQRARFLPFIDVMKKHMEIQTLNGDKDYRSMKREAGSKWLCPLNNDTEEDFDILFREAVGYDPIETHEIHVGDKDSEGSRTWTIPFASKSAAKLDMAVFLTQPLGAADFMALAERYPLLFLDNLSLFTVDGRDRTKRFMVMIDVLYDKGVKLAVRAADIPEQLYPAQGSLNFEFSRTISRLKEMTKKS